MSRQGCGNEALIYNDRVANLNSKFSTWSLSIQICYASPPMRDIKGAVAVVTGAASGIGRALAVDLAKLGAQLALADVNTAGVEETHALLGNAIARTYTVDVSKASAVEGFAHAVERDFGRASLLINNAGVALMGTFAEVSLEEMEWLIGINFWGVVHGCKFFLPLLQPETDAHIVNLSSIFGLIGPPGQTAYAASKFAIRGFSESLREELRATSAIKVTSVHPAGIATPIANRARAGRAITAAARQEAEEYFKKVALITPQEASSVIIKGVLANKNRVLIGSDAYRIDRIQRLFPARASAIFASFLEKRRGPKSQAATSASKSV
jgi:NAD(P)-dependent dehydrogenase (short-subunit alcohol dehydrogenase family)